MALILLPCSGPTRQPAAQLAKPTPRLHPVRCHPVHASVRPRPPAAVVAPATASLLFPAPAAACTLAAPGRLTRPQRQRRAGFVVVAAAKAGGSNRKSNGSNNSSNASSGGAGAKGTPESKAMLQESRFKACMHVIETQLGLPKDSLRPCPAEQTIFGQSRPETIARKLTALLAAFPDPDQQPLIKLAIRRCPRLLRAAEGTVIANINNLVAVLRGVLGTRGAVSTVAAGSAKAADAAAAAATKSKAKAGKKGKSQAGAENEQEEDDEGLRRLRLREVLRLVCGDPRLALQRASNLLVKIQTLEAALERDKAFVLDMLVRNPRLIPSLTPASLAAKAALVKQMAALSPNWTAELQAAGPSKVAELLMAGPDVLNRLQFLAKFKKRTVNSVRAVVSTTRQLFEERYPDYPAWLEKHKQRKQIRRGT